jgi:hypothetical protein
MSGKIIKRIILGAAALIIVGAIGALVGAIGGAIATVTMMALFSVSTTLVTASGIGALLGAMTATIWMANVLYTHRGIPL